jgi:sugar transferase (PEP-CTERM system associated)
MIKVWRYWIARPRTPLLAAQSTLVAGVMLHLAWAGHSTSFAGTLPQSTGLLLLLLLPQMCLYLRRYEATLMGDDYSRFLSEVLAALGIGLIVAVILFWMFPQLFPGPTVGLAAVAGSVLGLLFFRPFLRWLFRRKKFVEGLLVLGSGEMASKFYRELAKGPEFPVRRNGHSHLLHASIAAVPDEAGIAVSFEQLRQMTEQGVSRIVVAEPNVHSSQALAAAIVDCKLRGLEVEPAVESYERFNSKLWLEGIRPDWLVYTVGFKPPRYYLQIKRVLDRVLAVALMVVTTPLLAVIAAAIKLDSKGDVLFRQERVGWHGKPFILYKFRTMLQDAERATGPVWAEAHDPRITRVGRFLRRLRLDELPQLLNVLRGEMSLIGPRPERPHFVKLLTDCVPYYGLRHCVKPGVTGWAQVLYPYGASVEDAYEKLQYDLYYAKHMSLALDSLILVNTLKVVLFGRGR